MATTTTTMTMTIAEYNQRTAAANRETERLIAEAAKDGFKQGREYERKANRNTMICLWQLVKGQEEHATFTADQWLQAVRAIIDTEEGEG